VLSSGGVAGAAALGVNRSRQRGQLDPGHQLPAVERSDVEPGRGRCRRPVRLPPDRRSRRRRRLRTRRSDPTNNIYITTTRQLTTDELHHISNVVATGLTPNAPLAVPGVTSIRKRIVRRVGDRALTRAARSLSPASNLLEQADSTFRGAHQRANGRCSTPRTRACRRRVPTPSYCPCRPKPDNKPRTRSRGPPSRRPRLVCLAGSQLAITFRTAAQGSVQPAARDPKQHPSHNARTPPLPLKRHSRVATAPRTDRAYWASCVVGGCRESAPSACLCEAQRKRRSHSFMPNGDAPARSGEQTAPKQKSLSARVCRGFTEWSQPGSNR